MAEAGTPEYEKLLAFLKRVAKDPAAHATWAEGGARALLDKEGGGLHPEHKKVLEVGDCAEICATLHMETEADVTAQQLAHIGPCWVLVG